MVASHFDVTISPSSSSSDDTRRRASTLDRPLANVAHDFARATLPRCSPSEQYALFFATNVLAGAAAGLVTVAVKLPFKVVERTCGKH